MEQPKPIDYDLVTGEYRKTTLDSGLRIVTESMPHVQSLAIGIWVLTGSRFEQLSQNGISHLLEHMVFKGTQTRSAYDIAISLEALGGHLNAFTEREHTCYYAIVLKDNLKEAVDILSDLVLNPGLDSKDLKKEKQVIVEEIHNLEDTPEDLVHDIWTQTVFGDNALGWPILGTEESVMQIQEEDIDAYRRQYYSANNIIVAAAGALDHRELVGLVETAFYRLLPSTIDTPKSANEPREAIDKIVKGATSQLHLCTGSTTYGYLDKRKFPLIVMNTYLGGGMSSRLFQELRETRGMAYSVFSNLDFWVDIGLFSIYIGSNPKNQNEILNILKKEMDQLAEKPLSESDLNRVKSQLSRSIVLSLEDHSNRMSRLAKMEAYTHEYFPISDVVQLIQDVNQDDIQLVSEQTFQKQVQISTSICPE